MATALHMRLPKEFNYGNTQIATNRPLTGRKLHENPHKLGPQVTAGPHCSCIALCAAYGSDWALPLVQRGPKAVSALCAVLCATASHAPL